MLTGVRDRLGRELFLRVAGPDGPRARERIHATPGPRLHDPDSPIGWVHGDAAMFVGGIRALLLQTMHPVAMHAVTEHSGYRGDLWGRLARTSTFIATTTFGTQAHALQAIAAVRAIHGRVTGTLPDGRPYAASDPQLLAWVHAAEIDSFLRAHAVYGARRLTPKQRDTYVAQTADVARLLGVLDPPMSAAQLERTLAAYRPQLRGTEPARAAARFLLLPAELPLVARPAYLTLMAAAIELLPGWSRRELRLPRLPVAERVVVRVLAGASVGTIRWALAPGRQHTRELAAARTAGTRTSTRE